METATLIQKDQVYCARCQKTEEEWSLLYQPKGERLYCCEHCLNNAGCTCDFDNADYLMSRCFA